MGHANWPANPRISWPKTLPHPAQHTPTRQTPTGDINRPINHPTRLGSSCAEGAPQQQAQSNTLHGSRTEAPGVRCVEPTTPSPPTTKDSQMLLLPCLNDSSRPPVNTPTKHSRIVDSSRHHHPWACSGRRWKQVAVPLDILCLLPALPRHSPLPASLSCPHKRGR